MKKEITIYTSETCSYCKQFKEKLAKDGSFSIKEKLTSEHKDEFKEISNLLGIGTVPLIVFKNNYFVPARDFNNADHLLLMLNGFVESSFSLEERSYQRNITLNYNMSVAFNKLDYLLRQIENKLNIKKDEHKSTS